MPLLHTHQRRKQLGVVASCDISQWEARSYPIKLSDQDPDTAIKKLGNKALRCFEHGVGGYVRNLSLDFYYGAYSVSDGPSAHRHSWTVPTGTADSPLSASDVVMNRRR
jgi:hypothetical protein